MWLIFKILNFTWLMSSTYMWLTTYLPLLPVIFLINVLMIICLGLMPIKIEITKATGRILLAIILLVIWETKCTGFVMGIFLFLSYMPVIYLIMLPYEYLRDILRCTTKWYAILLIPGLIIYGVTMFITLPSFGRFVHPVYEPFLNYIFYLKTTFDHGTFIRFNAFFLEPGHQALFSSFILMANRFKFKENKWLLVPLTGVIFSFSLAGYLLTATGFVLLYINTIGKALTAIALGALLVTVALNFSGGDNALNELIVSRMEYDEEKGIKGNNRFTNDTDFVYKQAVRKGTAWYGVRDNTNMNLIAGAGFKIYVINYGFIGVLLVLFFYLSVIPSHPAIKYTLSFLIVLSLCFIQRAYPAWYSWLFCYVTGIYIAKADKDNNEMEYEHPYQDIAI